MKKWVSTTLALLVAVLLAVYLNFTGVSLAKILSYYVITFVLFLILKWELSRKFKGRKTYFEKDGHRLRKVAEAGSLRMEESWKDFKRTKKNEEVEDPIERRAKRLKQLEQGR